MKYRIAGLAPIALLAICTLSVPWIAAAGRPTAAACVFELGFASLHDMIPSVVGDCKTNEYHNADNGDGLQETSGGLLVWRKADNWTAFTDGTTTWINGPQGLQSRPNDQRFSWEGSAPVPTVPSPTPVPATPAPAPQGGPVNEDQARAIALEHFPGAWIEKVDLGPNDDGVNVYAVQVWDPNGRGHEVQVDPNTGAVVGIIDDEPGAQPGD